MVRQTMIPDPSSVCTSKFSVTFPMFAKIDLNGTNAHPLYQHLKFEKPGILGTEAIKWNFTNESWKYARGETRKRTATSITIHSRHLAPILFSRGLQAITRSKQISQYSSLTPIHMVGEASVVSHK